MEFSSEIVLKRVIKKLTIKIKQLTRNIQKKLISYFESKQTLQITVIFY